MKVSCLLISDDQLREEAGKAAQARIREHYLWPKITAEIEQVYQEMMGVSEAESVAPARIPAISITAARRMSARPSREERPPDSASPGFQLESMQFCRRA